MSEERHTGRKPAGKPVVSAVVAVAVASVRVHADAGAVPAPSTGEQAELQADIAQRGVQVPLELTAAGRVLDGRGRLAAAKALGLDEVPVRVVAPPDEREYMVLAALRRRNLTASQKAALALELSDYQAALQAGRERSRANLKGAADVAMLPPRGRSCEQVAALANVAPRVVTDAATVQAEDPDLFAQIKSGETPAHRAALEVRRRRRYAQIGEAPPLPEGPFQLIYADPPWQLGNASSQWAPEQHYPTLPLEQIKALDVPAADDAVLYLWSVSALLPEALQVIAAWGFEYKSTLVWVKDGIGPGQWARNRHELLLIAKRGRISPPAPELRPDSVIEAPRRAHSQKPDQAYTLIERAYPELSKLELFARAARPGWTAWGNQANTGGGR